MAASSMIWAEFGNSHVCYTRNLEISASFGPAGRGPRRGTLPEYMLRQNSNLSYPI
jgi:hypothetical protein